MHKKYCLPAILLFLLLIINCAEKSHTTAVNQPVKSTTQSNPGKSSAEHRETSFADPISDEKALEFLYNNYNTKEKYSLWQPNEKEMAKFGYTQKDSFYQQWNNLQVSVLFSKNFTQAGIERYILVTQAAPPDLESCPICAPEVGATVFYKKGKQWQIELERWNFGKLGQYGSVAIGNFIRVGPDKYGVIFEPVSTYKAEIDKNYLILLVYEDNGFKKVFHELCGIDNSADCENEDCGNYHSTYAMREGKNKDYFDLWLTTLGTKVDKNSKVVPANQITSYTYKNGKYVLASQKQIADPFDLATED